MIQRWIITPGEEMIYKLRVFKEITNRVLALRHAEIQKARLEIQRERLELLREKQRNKSGSSEPTGVGAGGMSGQEASRSPVSSSADSASLESAESSSPVGAEVPEPNRSVIPYPPPSEEADTPHPPIAAAAESLPAPPAEDAAPQSAAPQKRPEPSIATSKPTAPTAPQQALFSPSPRSGGPPRNANPRNPLGLL